LLCKSRSLVKIRALREEASPPRRQRNENYGSRGADAHSKIGWGENRLFENIFHVAGAMATGRRATLRSKTQRQY
jgi:hypothetical protein